MVATSNVIIHLCSKSVFEHRGFNLKEFPPFDDEDYKEQLLKFQQFSSLTRITLDRLKFPIVEMHLKSKA